MQEEEQNVETIMKYKQYVYDLLVDRTSAEQESPEPVYTWEEVRQLVNRADEALDAYSSQAFADCRKEMFEQFKMNLFASEPPSVFSVQYFTEYLLDLPISEYSLKDLGMAALVVSPFMWILYFIFTK